MSSQISRQSVTTSVMKLPPNIETGASLPAPVALTVDYWQTLPGGHSGGNPPPSANAVVADIASSAAAIRMNRISVFFMDAPLLGWGTLAKKHNPAIHRFVAYFLCLMFLSK